MRFSQICRILQTCFNVEVFFRTVIISPLVFVNNKENCIRVVTAAIIFRPNERKSMRITRLISQLVDTVGPYIPFIGSSPLTNSSVPVEMKHKKSNNSASAASPPKGKGKGKEKEKSDIGETIDLKDLPLKLPEFANGDHVKIVPRYSSGILKYINSRI
jgi:hypothetical protein